MADAQDVYFRQTQQVRDRVDRTMVSAWSQLPSYRDADMDRWRATVLPAVLAGQRTVAQLTAAHLGGRGAAVDTWAVTGEVLRGVDPAEVYQRPAVTVWAALAAGRSLELAARAGLSRARKLAATDMQLARTHTARAVMSAGGVQYYARVLSGSENCALCVVASTQRYRVKDLLPIHPGCDCGVRALSPREAVSQVIDEQLLEDVHDVIEEQLGITPDRGGRAPDYRKLIVTRQHGEYGPLLTARHRGFTGPDDLPDVTVNPAVAAAPRPSATLPHRTGVDIQAAAAERAAQIRDEAATRAAEIAERAAQFAAARRGTPPVAAAAGDGPPPVPPVPRSGAASESPDEYPPGPDGTRPPWRPSQSPTVPDSLRRKILDGIQVNGKLAGGHRSGTGRPGATEFPADWSDDRIIREIEETIRRPDGPAEKHGDQFVFVRTVDGVTVWVSVRTDQVPPQIWSAYPLPGGQGVRTNPR